MGNEKTVTQKFNDEKKAFHKQKKDTIAFNKPETKTQKTKRTNKEGELKQTKKRKSTKHTAQ